MIRSLMIYANLNYLTIETPFSGEFFGGVSGAALIGRKCKRFVVTSWSILDAVLTHDELRGSLMVRSSILQIVL